MTDTEFQFLGWIADLQKGAIWTEWKRQLEARIKAGIASGSKLPDPMAGRAAAAAAELQWVIEFVETAKHRQEAEAQQRNEAAEEEAEQARLREEEQAAAGAHDHQSTTD